eukprot:8302227-Pyramimonas_sp.AAC.1
MPLERSERPVAALGPRGHQEIIQDGRTGSCLGGRNWLSLGRPFPVFFSVSCAAFSPDDQGCSSM